MERKQTEDFNGEEEERGREHVSFQIGKTRVIWFVAVPHPIDHIQ